MTFSRLQPAAPLPGVADPAVTPVVSFLQIFGISGESDKRWRREARRFPAPTA